jgi:hypothetical protein
MYQVPSGKERMPTGLEPEKHYAGETVQQL